VIRTGHHSLRWVLNLSDAQGRLARWRLRLFQFDFEVQYSPGKQHHAADTLSRLKPSDPKVASPTDPVDTEIPCFSTTFPNEITPTLLLLENFREQQATYEDCSRLVDILDVSPTVDYDSHGVIGHVLHSGEFQPLIPVPIAIATPITLLQEQTTPHVDQSFSIRGEASLLRKEVFRGPQDPFSPPGVCAPTDIVLP
jgi:hypothetical protein